VTDLQPRGPGCYGVMQDPAVKDSPAPVCCRDGLPCGFEDGPTDDNIEDCPRANPPARGYEPGDIERDETPTQGGTTE
jgi:hypothetical protein